MQMISVCTYEQLIHNFTDTTITNLNEYFIIDHYAETIWRSPQVNEILFGFIVQRNLLMYCMLDKIFNSGHLKKNKKKHLSYFLRENRVWHYMQIAS